MEDFILEGNEKIAYCGLYCPICSFETTFETKDTTHLLRMPDRYNHLKEQSIEECKCGGCKQQTDYCHCDMKPCAEEKGYISCADCDDFPCETLKHFANDGVPHHKDALLNLYRIREVGYDQWLEEMKMLERCQCGTRQSWYYRCSIHK